MLATAVFNLYGGQAGLTMAKTIARRSRFAAGRVVPLRPAVDLAAPLERLVTAFEDRLCGALGFRPVDGAVVEDRAGLAVPRIGRMSSASPSTAMLALCVTRMTWRRSILGRLMQPR